MCGIYAELSWSGPVGREVVVACRDEMVTRGPDDAGLHVSERGECALGHRRLSIIDLSPAARQPLSNEDGTVWVVANGEIYNFRELRGELEAAGHIFATGSDSEVLVHGYEQWGEGLPERLLGMFAFVVWDEGRRELFACRDRFGIKPLYVWRRPDGVAFASDLRALVRHPDFRRVVDGRSLAQYLCYGFVPSPRSIYADVQKAAPARWVRFGCDGRERSQTYWDLPPEDGRRWSDSGVVERLDFLLDGALRSHLVSDVPLGLLLSGGIDSTVLALLLQRRVPQGFSTFTIGYRGHERSEADDARVVAEHVGSTHLEGEAAVPDTGELLDLVSETYTEPMSDTSAIGVLALSEMTRRSVKVALGGDGGDEIFAGYPNIFRNHRPSGTRRDRLLLRWERLVGGDATHELASFHRSRYRLYDWRDVQKAVCPDASASFGPEAQAAPLVAHYDRRVPLLRRLQRLEMRTFLMDMILVKIDRASMRHSLEVRVPLLDHRLADFAFSLPARTVMPDKANKHLLRKWLGSRVREEILSKPKAGFGYPLDRDFDFDLARDRVVGGRLARDGWISRVWLESAWNADVPRRPNRRYLLAVLESWYRRWQPTDLSSETTAA